MADPTPMTAPVDTPESVLERATSLIFDDMCQLAQDYDIPRETVWNDPDAMCAARETAKAILALQRALLWEAEQSAHSEGDPA